MEILILPLRGCFLIPHDEELQPPPIIIVVVKPSVGRIPVPPRPPSLLHIVLQRLWERGVDDKPYILLIDPHAKSDGGDHNLDLAVHPLGLDIVPLVIIHVRVVIISLYLVHALQLEGQVLSLLL